VHSLALRLTLIGGDGESNNKGYVIDGEKGKVVFAAQKAKLRKNFVCVRKQRQIESEKIRRNSAVFAAIAEKRTRKHFSIDCGAEQLSMWNR